MFFEGQTWCHWGQLCTLQPCVGMSTSCECSWKQDAWIADICRPTDHLHVQSTRRQLHSVSFLCCGMCAQKFWQNGNRQEGKTLKRQETKERKHFFFLQTHLLYLRNKSQHDQWSRLGRFHVPTQKRCSFHQSPNNFTLAQSNNQRFLSKGTSWAHLYGVL